jgi:hypothetical protein
MPSVADDCWRLSADCSHWAEESRDNSARLAFRQMALAWAGLAFSQDFILPTDQKLDPTSSETEQVAPAENTASSQVDAWGLEQTTRASINDSPEQRERLSLPSPIPLLPANEQVDPTSSENSLATPVENTASSRTENEIIVPVSNAAVDAGSHEQRTGASTNNSPGQRERLSLRLPTPFPKR